MDILIRRATMEDCASIAEIGRVAVEFSHRGSCSEEDANYFLDNHYNQKAIEAELNEATNIYHMILYKGQPAGFSKIILNAAHPNIAQPDTTKLDRIYLLSQFYDKKLGYQLLQENIKLSKEYGQQAMWLFTWQGNERAVNFYKRNGFAIIGEHKFKVTDTHYNPHYHMLLKY